MNDTERQQSAKMLKTGIAGSLIAAVCCFTPLLVLAFAGAGLSGLVGGIDFVVFPVMFASLGVVAQALYIRAGRPGASPKTVIAILVVAFAALLIWLEFRYALRISLAAVALVAIYGLYVRKSNAQTA
ncbi:MAG: mercury resistance system transport protein MerF [Flavobacteriaceae bacterium]|nr:mercury resistance system transport protein MerF [Flavobacteriaceae bacterium]